MAVGNTGDLPATLAAGVSDDAHAFCILQATVPTGLESGAAHECSETFGSKATRLRGKVVVPILVKEDVLKAKGLKSVDHVHVLVKSIDAVCEDAADVLEHLRSLPRQLQWDHALEAWGVFHGQWVGREGEERVSFRVTCNRSGPQLGFTSMDAAREFGAGIVLHFGWQVNLKKPDVHIVLNVTGRAATVLLSLTEHSQHIRNISHFGPTCLRSTVCYGLLRLAELQPGDFVLDPMCGGGSISIEGSLGWPTTFHIAGDVHELAVPRARANVDGLHNANTTDILRWDVTRLPLRAASIDVVVTDLPFGKRSGSYLSNRVLYPRALHEMGRVVRPESGRAVLLTADYKTLGQAVVEQGVLWRRRVTHWVNLGGLRAAVYLLSRTSHML